MPAAPLEALPHTVFDDSLSLFFNDEEIKLIHLPNAHTDSDIAVIFTKSKVASVGDVFVTLIPVTDYASAKRCDTERHARFFRAMLQRGIYLPPSQFESWFLSFAHLDADVETTLAAAEEAFQEVRT